MLVYRIALEKYAHSLTASGRAARWNPDGYFVLYTAQNLSLACLENVVHRSGRGLNDSFSTMVIEIPDHLPVSEVDTSVLPPDWKDVVNYPECRQYGERWLQSGASAILRAPSVIVPGEFNYILSLSHPDFRQVRLIRIEKFVFDGRIKKDNV